MRSLFVLSILAVGGCNIFGGGPVPNPFPPIPDAGVIVRVRNEIGITVDATIVYTDDGVEVRRTDLVVSPSAADQFVEIEKTVVDRIIALAVVSARNATLPSNLKVGDPLFAKVFTQGTDFAEGDTLTIVIKSETPVVQPLPDCNNNQVPDVFEITLNPAADCDDNGELDACEIAANPALDCNRDGKLNVCENQAPVISSCPPSRSVTVGEGCTAVMPDLRPEVQAADNCTPKAALVITQSPAAGSAITSAGPIAVTLSVDDGQGHVSTCTATVTAVDDQPPVIQSCSKGETIETIEASVDCSAAMPDFASTLLAADNCTPVAALVREQSPPAGTLVNAGTSVEVTLTVRDQSGLSASCEFTVRAVEHNVPVITCPPDRTVQCDVPITPGDKTPVGIATAVDDCDPSPNVTYFDVVIPYDPFDGGNPDGGGKLPECGVLIRRTWVATDSSGNTNSCNQLILVTDTVPPEITCPPAVQLECGESIDPGNPLVGRASATDVCDSEPILDYYDSFGEPTCASGQVVIRTWFAIDKCHNYSDCTQIITIVDTQPPVLTVPDDVTVQCDDSTDPSSLGYATAIDGCASEPSVTYMDETPTFSGPTCEGYIIIRHWTATDDCEHSVTTDQIITVVDTEGPNITECPGNQVLPVGPDCTVSMPDLREGVSAYDNCSTSFSVSQSPAPGALLSPGIYTVTFTATDHCDNSSQCAAELTVAPQVPGGVLFVDHNAEGANDGSSWGDAFNELSRALARAACAASPVDIWVARGTYQPDSGTGDRYRSFMMHNNVRLYGGFAGNETEVGQRDPANNPVILSGDLGNPGISDNSLHVLVANQVAVGGVLDGFTITGGNANIASTSADSGGLLLNGSSPLIRNCKFIANRALLTGGAIQCQFDSDPVIENCTFQGNSAATGGALRCWSDSRPVLRNCLFTGNTATLGGAVEHNADAWPTYVNCVFVGNSADGGGAIANTGSVATFINCTIYANTGGASRGGGIRSNGGNTTVVNCILWGNTDSGSSVVQAQVIDFIATTAVTYSCIQDGEPGDGSIPFGGAANHNIDGDPRLTFPQQGDFGLMWNSPCIDAGNNADVPVGITTDFAGNQRIVDGDSNEFATVDMGAVEFQGE